MQIYMIKYPNGYISRNVFSLEDLKEKGLTNLIRYRLFIRLLDGTLYYARHGKDLDVALFDQIHGEKVYRLATRIWKPKLG